MSSNNMNRRDFLRSSAAAASMAAVGFQSLFYQEGLKNTKPNIILFFCDDLGYGDLGCCGNEEVITPNVDRLATEGVRFTDFYVTWPACTPSRSGLLTGRYPQRNGLYNMIRNDMVNYKYLYDEDEYAVSEEMTLGMDVREIVIAQELKKAGYTTGIVGKWDSGRAKRFMPLQRGFDFFYGFSNTGIDYWTHERYGVPSMFRGNERIKEEGYATELFKREALNFIRQNKDTPFYLYLPFNAPHGASNFDRTGPQAPDEYIRMYGEPPGTNKMRYLANITCMDNAVGEVLALVKELGLENNTLVIFTSDNGGSGIGRNAPLRAGKGSMFEGGIREPFIAKWPGQIPSGTVSNEFTTTLEFFPTFLAVAGTKPPKELKLDGFNMLPVLKCEEKSQRREMYWQAQRRCAARIDNWKWVEMGKGGGGLFDLSTDIGEQNDLSEKRPEILKMVKRKWDAWRKEMDEVPPRGPFTNY